MTDWSLDPRVRAVLGRLPLPVQLPTPLVRTEGPTRVDELAGRRAVLTRLRDPLDVALATGLAAAGAAVVVADPEPASELYEALQPRPVLAPWTHDVAGGLLAAIRSSGAREDRRPVILVHRVVPPAEAEPAVNDTTDRLFAAGHAAAHLPKSSRLVLLLGRELQAAGGGALLSAAAAGMARSAAKEMGKQGTTVHVVRQGRGEPGQVAQTVAFLASPRAAFLTSLDLTLDRAPAPQPAPTDLPLAGRIAVVTGAARGIGAAIAKRLAAEGAHVWINDLPAAEAGAQETLAAIRRAGGRASFAAADIGTSAGAASLAEAIRKSDGRVDVVVHNAGITRDRTLRKMSLAQWRLVLQVDFGAMVEVHTALEPLLQPGGSLVLMSSVMGIAGNFGQANYSAAKGAVIALGRQWAQDLAGRGVRANVIAPGFILTEMTAQVPWFNREMAKQLTALLQPGQPEDVAELTCFLAGPRSAAVNGQVLRCDGGMAFGA